MVEEVVPLIRGTLTDRVYKTCGSMGLANSVMDIKLFDLARNTTTSKIIIIVTALLEYIYLCVQILAISSVFEGALRVTSVP